MRLHSRTFRLLAFGFALAQYALTGALAILDASVENRSAQVAAHVESSGVPCGLVHHAAECAVCHFLGLRIGNAPQPYVVPSHWVTTDVSPVLSHPYAPARSERRHLLPRAPPLVIA